MVEYLMASIVTAILGAAAGAAFLWALASRARRRRELTRKRREITSQQELEDFIRRVDQVTVDEELNHLDKKETD